jgi:hypothetical protein
LTTPAGTPASTHSSANQQRRQRRLLGRLEDHGVAAGQRRRDLPGQHQQRKVPGHDLADHAQGPVVRPLALEQLRPAGMVIEVPHRERDVDVARLADGLAVVQGLQHREQACMLLQAARQRVQHARAPMAAQRLPGGQRRGGGLHRLVDLRGAGLRHLRQFAAARRVQGGEVARAAHPAPADEVAEAAAVAFQPGLGDGIGLRRRAVVHGLEDGRDRVHRQGSAWRWAAL